MHKKCPASQRVGKKILPSAVVYYVLDVLGKYKYGAGKSIAFYLYSDSLNDPRLFKFLEYAAKKCPAANIIIGSNGWYFDEVMAEELYESGATYILLTAYTDAEQVRLNEIRNSVSAKLAVKFPRCSFSIRNRRSLDSRLGMTGRKGTCYSPLTEILIAPDSRLRLCCLDVHQAESLASIAGGNFEKVLLKNYQRLYNLRQELIKGDRTLDVCQKCSCTSRMRNMYIKKQDIRPAQSLLRRFVK
jgi:hypothetical protein